MSAIKGLDSFLDVLAVINNPSIYEEKVKELKEQSEKYEEVVKAVVELSKVNEYTVSIKQREEQSKTTLIAAQKTAADITSEASIKAKELIDEKRVQKNVQ